jgi:hypothetical protein
MCILHLLFDIRLMMKAVSSEILFSTKESKNDGDVHRNILWNACCTLLQSKKSVSVLIIVLKGKPKVLDITC